LCSDELIDRLYIFFSGKSSLGCTIHIAIDHGSNHIDPAALLLDIILRIWSQSKSYFEEALSIAKLGGRKKSGRRKQSIP
jgi:hypothetical protein